jgi:hypothetical protein
LEIETVGIAIQEFEFNVVFYTEGFDFIVEHTVDVELTQLEDTEPGLHTSIELGFSGSGVRETVIKGKGVSTRYLEASYTWEDYKACSEGKIDENKLRLEFNNIQRSNYNNVTKTINKVALSNFDDKMFHFRNAEGVWESLPHGHRKIAEIKAKNEKLENPDIE